MSLCVALTGESVRAGRRDAVEIGGKARSLLRLARGRLSGAGGIRGQRPSSSRGCARAGPALPRALRDAADLAALDRAREALAAAPWPPGFQSELDRNLDRVAARAPDARFSVRSSFAGEDGGAAIAAGVYESVVGVARGDVPAAIRRVLASGLSPGAVTYAGDGGGGAREAAVLIHGYVDGPAGSAAFDPSSGQPVVIEPSDGAISDAARAEIERALRDLAAREGHAVEVEWVLDGAERGLVVLADADLRRAARGASLVGPCGAGPRRVALGRRPQPTTAVAGAGRPGRALRRALPHRHPPAHRRRPPVFFTGPPGPRRGDRPGPGGCCAGGAGRAVRGLAAGPHRGALARGRAGDLRRALRPDLRDDPAGGATGGAGARRFSARASRRRGGRASGALRRCRIHGRRAARASRRSARRCLRRRARYAARRLPGALRRRSSDLGRGRADLPRGSGAAAFGAGGPPGSATRCRGERVVVAAVGARDRDTPRAGRPSHLRDLARGRATRARGGRGRRLALRTRAGRRARGAASRGPALGRGRPARGCRRGLLAAARARARMGVG